MNAEEVLVKQTIIFEGKLYKIDEKNPFSGLVYSLYPNGSLEYKGKYEDGVPNGLLIYWYENGNKKREGQLNNGSPSGRWKYYNSDGSKYKQIDYEI